MLEDTSSNAQVMGPHPDLQLLRTRLRDILDDMVTFGPVIPKPPILYSSSRRISEETIEETARRESVPGLRALRDAVRRDLGVLDTFLDDPHCASLPPLSTNAPYLIAVWNEVLLAPPPVTTIWHTYHNSENRAVSRRRGSQKPPGVKVDVIADDGRRWIRVNTTKNSRLLAEFREIDSYMTDSEDDSDEGTMPTLAPVEFDNSILKTGRSLIHAARQHPVSTINELPAVTLRLTRLDPDPINEQDYDPRIATTIQELRKMGIDVQLGERSSTEVLSATNTSQAPPPHILEPTLQINLDLSILIALISDITHAPLPQSAAEAESRFVPPPEYIEWKKKRLEMKKPSIAHDHDIDDLEEGSSTHSRALVNQTLQEMHKGLLQEIRDRVMQLQHVSEPHKEATTGDPRFPPVEFWTTPEARDRCLRIALSKIGGVNEQRRAQALFRSSVSPSMTLEEAEDVYWRSSRYRRGFLPLLPIRIFPSSEPPASPLGSRVCDNTNHPQLPMSPFFVSLAQRCRDILAREPVLSHGNTEHTDEPSVDVERQSSANSEGLDIAELIPRASVTRANPRLTAHTVQSILWGAACGWTTLTANKNSVKAILKEMKAAGGALTQEAVSCGPIDTRSQGSAEKAALWVMDPRSLAEGMKSET